MNSSLLMPSAFFLILFWAELGPARRAGTATLLALGLALLIMIVAQNVQSLIAQARAQPPGCASARGRLSTCECACPAFHECGVDMQSLAEQAGAR